MKKLNKKEYILIGLFVIIAILIIVLVTGNHSHDTYTSILSRRKNKYSLVSVPSTFFTVQGCAEKYINTVARKENENIVILLNDNYKTKKGIDSSNVLDKVDGLDGSYSFKALKIYQEKINSDQTRYYLYGKLKKNVMDVVDEGKDYYLIVDIYNESYTFDVTPYNGKLFKEVE